MAENLVTHIVFNICAHHMSVICDKITAAELHENQSQHSHANGKNGRFCLRYGHISYSIHNITHKKGDHKRNCCTQNGKK